MFLFYFFAKYLRINFHHFRSAINFIDSNPSHQIIQYYKNKLLFIKHFVVIPLIYVPDLVTR